MRFIRGSFRDCVSFVHLVKSSDVNPKMCPTLSDPMDCSLPGSSIHGIFQARILEWIAVPFSRGSSQPRDPTRFPTLQEDIYPQCS